MSETCAVQYFGQHLPLVHDANHPKISSWPVDTNGHQPDRRLFHWLVQPHMEFVEREMSTSCLWSFLLLVRSLKAFLDLSIAIARDQQCHNLRHLRAFMVESMNHQFIFLRPFRAFMVKSMVISWETR